MLFLEYQQWETEVGSEGEQYLKRKEKKRKEMEAKWISEFKKIKEGSQIEKKM